MSMAMQITRGKIAGAQKVVIYGPEGIGKSTFASQFPDVIFSDTEGSTNWMDVARLPKPSSWTMLLEQARYIRDNPSLCSSYAIDTADWAERLCIEHICATVPHEKGKQITGIEDYGFGKGYTYAMEEFGRFLNLLQEIIDRGINICITAHAKPRKFELPEEMGSYDRWEMKLSKQVAPLLKEWADMVLFANYKIHVVNVDDKGAQKGKNKAQGGGRVMYTTHHTCWDAKHRHGFPDELPFEFSAIAHCIPTIAPVTGIPVTTPMPAENSFNELADEAQKMILEYAEDVIKAMPDQSSGATINPQAAPPISGIPKPLADLMEANQVTEAEIQAAVALRGYYPINTPIANYDASFVAGVLIGAWGQVFQMIQDIRNEATPFN